VLIDSTGQRSFAHHPGAPQRLDRNFFMSRMALFAQSRSALIGYYSLLPDLEPDLPEVLATIRETGCLTAMDSAGSGGEPGPLRSILPYLDIYIPSLTEARAHTGVDQPREILDAFRGMGAPGLLGVKLGAQGALISPRAGDYLAVPAIVPPGEVVDTTGAGDAFYAGLMVGLLNGYALESAAKLAAATGALCVTGIGASAGLRSLQETKRLAGL
jgi:sugar/nucleoside kinase (ribokinase family)